jgi:uncharacterized membrane protein
MLGKKKVNRNGLVYRVVHGHRSLGQKTADGLAKWAGSWTFIILFFVFLGIWMGTNGIFVLRYIRGDLIDPYPFILLNLVLSCLAAIQAPVILMSQNRQSQKDRTKMEYDYRVNRRADKNIEKILKKLGAIEGRVVGK